jgi:hypothetical protein
MNCYGYNEMLPIADMQSQVAHIGRLLTRK